MLTINDTTYNITIEGNQVIISSNKFKTLTFEVQWEPKTEEPKCYLDTEVCRDESCLKKEDPYPHIQEFRDCFVLNQDSKSLDTYYYHKDIEDCLSLKREPANVFKKQFKHLTYTEDDKSKPVFDVSKLKRAAGVTVDMSSSDLIITKNGRSYINTYIKPTTSTCDIMNWRGDISIQEEVNEFMINQIGNVFCNNQDDAHYLTLFLKGLYDPTYKPQSTVLLIDIDGGAGKTSVMNKLYKTYFGSTFKTASCKSISGKGRVTDLVNTFTSLVIFNETVVSTFNDENFIKEMLSDGKMRVSRSGKDDTYEPVYFRSVFMSNLENPFLKGDVETQRRFSIFRCNSNYVCDSFKFDKVLKYDWRYFAKYLLSYKGLPITAPYKPFTIARSKIDPYIDFWVNEVIPKYDKLRLVTRKSDNVYKYVIVNDLRVLYNEVNDPITHPAKMAIFYKELSKLGVLDYSQVFQTEIDGKRNMNICKIYSKQEGLNNIFKKLNVKCLCEKQGYQRICPKCGCNFCYLCVTKCECV